MIKVCILNMKGNFDSSLGIGTQKTSFELWRNMSPISGRMGVDLEKVELGFGSGSFARKASLTMMLRLRDFSAYDVVHLLIAMPQTPRHAKRTKILTTVNELLVLKKDSEPYRRLIQDAPAGQKNLLDSISTRVAKGITRQILESDYIAVNSSQTMEEAVSLGYPKERIFIVHHGVDERFLSPLKKGIRRSFKVGFIGALNVRKNLTLAIDAFKRTKSADSDFEIWGRPVLEFGNLLRQAGDDRRIKFMGFAPEDKLVHIYDRFDVFVFPSLYEGFGIPIIEAQSRGLPVIIYENGKVPEETAKYCFKAKNAADMARIIENLRRKGYDPRLQKKATAYARSFTRKQEAIDTIAVYKKIAKAT
jgi:glycosyltransferase involved in cell wall biosynthesis